MLHVQRIIYAEENMELRQLLETSQLSIPALTDVALGVYDDSRLIGCGFLKQDMLQGLAVDTAYQGAGILAILVTELFKLAVSYGKTHLYVITKPSMIERMTGLGMRLIAKAEPYAAFLECGGQRVRYYKDELEKIARGKPENRAAIVMNANPFTKGHRYLVEKAAAENEWVFLLVVEEELSRFSFKDRFAMVLQGVSDLPNVTVLSGDRYIISALTFPAYFTKEENLAAAQCSMDAEMFCAVAADALKIKCRYVGTEPKDRVTAIYNKVLQERLPRHGIVVIEAERLESKDTGVVSASLVRKALDVDNWMKVKEMVPVSTYEYLKKLEE